MSNKKYAFVDEFGAFGKINDKVANKKDCILNALNNLPLLIIKPVWIVKRLSDLKFEVN